MAALEKEEFWGRIREEKGRMKKGGKQKKGERMGKNAPCILLISAFKAP